MPATGTRSVPDQDVGCMFYGSTGPGDEILGRCTRTVTHMVEESVGTPVRRLSCTAHADRTAGLIKAGKFPQDYRVKPFLLAVA